MDQTPRYSQQTAFSCYTKQLSNYNLRPCRSRKSINLLEVLKASQSNELVPSGNFDARYYAFRQRDIPYAFDSVRNNTVLMHSNIKHDGCVNSARWHYQSDYDILVTGSDDKTVKLWKYEYGSRFPISLLHTIETNHRSNIFNAEICPTDSNKLVSCAADGAVILHNLTNKYEQSNLLQSESLIHSFIFDCEDSNVIYVAEDSGAISVLDLRAKSRVNTLFSNKFAKKAIIQSPILGNSSLFVAETDTFWVFRVDLRFSPSECEEIFPYLSSYSPVNPTPTFNDDTPALSFAACKEVLARNHNTGVSVSGMTISRDSRTLLVSFQGDSIYSFPIDGYNNKNESPKDVGANGIYGGHINSSTFLKNVQFYGPNDEYILTGSDCGYLWIYDTEAGKIENKNESERDVIVVNVLEADKSVCNGSAVHIHDPCFVTYGIGSKCKLWGYGFPDKKNQLSKLYTLPLTMKKAVDSVKRNGIVTVSRPSSTVYDYEKFMYNARAINNGFKIAACNEENDELLNSCPYYPVDYRYDYDNNVKNGFSSRPRIDVNSFIKAHFHSNKYITKCADKVLTALVHKTNSIPIRRVAMNELSSDPYAVTLFVMIASDCKQNGNDLSQKKHFKDALSFYDKCLAYSYYLIFEGHPFIHSRNTINPDPCNFEVSSYTLLLLEGQEPPPDMVNISKSSEYYTNVVTPIMESENWGPLDNAEYTSLLSYINVEIIVEFVETFPVKLVQACLQNKVAVFLALQEYNHAHEAVIQAFTFIKSIPTLVVDPKLLYRAAIVHYELHHYEEALVHISEYNKVKPDDPLGANKFKEIQQKLKEQTKKEQKKYQKAFG